MTDLADFLPEVLVEAPKCPRQTAIRALRQAAIRLCEDAPIWQDNIAAGDVEADVDDYRITPPTDSRVVSVLTVMWNSARLILPATAEELDAIDNGWRLRPPGEPTRFISPDLEPDRIRFNRLPETTITDGLEVSVVLKPTQGATTVGDVLYADWLHTIAAGALQALLTMPGKDWTDAGTAVYYGRLFAEGLARAKARALKGNQRKPTQVQMRRWV